MARQYKNNWKLGFIGFINPPPPEIQDPLQHILWQMKRCQSLEMTVLQIASKMPESEKDLDALRQAMHTYEVEFELGAPRDIFELCGAGAKRAREAVLRQIKLAKTFDTQILRTGYGRLTLATSRFAPDGVQQMDSIIASLKEAGRIFEDEDMYFALENHVDFTGKEMVRIFEEVGSPRIGCALDTANGFSVYTDPNEDVEALAPYTITTHIKDMKVIDYNMPDTMPFMAVSVPLGQGHVDIPRALQLLEQKAPCPDGLHLVFEQGWYAGTAGDVDMRLHGYSVTEQSAAYIKTLIAAD